MIRDLDPAELARWRADEGRKPPLVVDVREPWEVERCALPGIVHVPMRELPARIGELPRERDVVVVCHHGVRSRQVAHYLVRLGYMAVWSLTGGVAAWADQVDPAMPRY